MFNESMNFIRRLKFYIPNWSFQIWWLIKGRKTQKIQNGSSTYLKLCLLGKKHRCMGLEYSRMTRSLKDCPLRQRNTLQFGRSQ